MPFLGGVIFCALLSLVATANAFAEQFNRRNVLPGGRAAMMGGAYTAISDDASGSWYNPAGLAFTRGSDVSMSANAFTRSRRSIEGALGGSDVADSSTSIYPAFAGGTTGLGALRIGYSFFTSDHENIDESFRYTVAPIGNDTGYTYSRRLLASGDFLHAGASVSLKLGNYISLGVGQFYYRRTRQAALIESSVYTTGAAFDSNVRQSTLNEGTVTTLGTMIRFPLATIGFSAKIPKRLADNTVIESSQVIYTGSTQDRTEATSKTRLYDEVVPPEYTLGVAWIPYNWFTLTADYTHIPRELSPQRHLDGVDTVKTENWGIGTEWVLGPLAMRGGIFSNNSLVAEPSALKLGQPASINYIGLTGGLAWRSKTSESSLGIIKQTGSGKDQSVSGSSTLYRVEAESTTYLLSSRYTISP